MSRGKQQRSKERRCLLEEAKASLKDLPMEQLTNLRFEVGRQLNQQQTVLNDIRTRLDAICMEIEGRKEEWDGYRITDHAVIRYLERHKGVNISNVRREIADMVRLAKDVDLQNPRRGTRFHTESGLTFGVDPLPDSQTVTTVYFDDELPVLKIPGEIVSVG